MRYFLCTEHGGPPFFEKILPVIQEFLYYIINFQTNHLSGEAQNNFLNILRIYIRSDIIIKINNLDGFVRMEVMK